MFDPILNHVEAAKARLLEQYKRKTRLGGLIESFVKQIQDLEDLASNLNTERSVDTATGAQLDGIGSIVGRTRNPGQSDADYRFDIRAKIIQNLTKGTPEEFISAAAFLLSADLVWFREVYVAAVDLFTDTDIPTDEEAEIRAQLEAFLPAGVSLDSFGVMPESDILKFGVDPGFGIGKFSKVFSTQETFALLTEGEELILTENDETLMAG